MNYFDINLLIILIIILSTIQSIAGVGILVLGTPMLLLMNFGILDIMLLLLPLSILNSFLNLSLTRYQNEINFDIKIGKYFLFICSRNNNWYLFS